MGRFLEKASYLLIAAGAAGWAASVLFYGGDVRYQMLSVLVLTIGIFVAHLWEELFYSK